jgi:hypothetical protein
MTIFGPFPRASGSDLLSLSQSPRQSYTDPSVENTGFCSWLDFEKSPKSLKSGISTSWKLLYTVQN